MKRFFPAVIAAYGMPLKLLIHREQATRTPPYAVSASTLLVCAQLGRRRPADSVAKSEPWTMKSRRELWKRMASPPVCDVPTMFGHDDSALQEGSRRVEPMLSIASTLAWGRAE